MFPYAMLNNDILIGYEVSKDAQKDSLTVVSARSGDGKSMTISLPVGAITEIHGFDQKTVDVLHSFIMASADAIQYLAILMDVGTQ